MKKTNKQASWRINVSLATEEKVQVFKAKERAKGNKMTKEEIVDYMILNFKENGTKRK